MKNDDEKKMYDNLGIKGAYFEEMYEKTDSDKADSEKKEIREIREIFSSKSKFRRVASVDKGSSLYRGANHYDDKIEGLYVPKEQACNLLDYVQVKLF